MGIQKSVATPALHPLLARGRIGSQATIVGELDEASPSQSMSSTLYSHFRLSSYENCPFQYKLKYVDRVQPPLGTTIEAFVGSRVHDALEWLYRLARDGRVATKEELVQKYQALWEAKWEDEIRVIKQELEVEHYRSNGQKWVEQYWDRYQPFDQGITIDLECKVFIDLPGGGKGDIAKCCV